MGIENNSTSGLVRARPFFCRLVPAAAILCFVVWCFISVRPDFSWDDADPEVLSQAWRLAKGQSIYHAIDAPPFTFAAYTPVYYALSALLMKFTGLNFLPAKLLSFLAALCIAWAFVRLDREWNNTVKGAVWAAFFLFLIPAFLYNSTRANVQVLAVAFSTWSLVFFLRNRRMETVIVSPLLAVLAFYTKQTQVALPLAMMIYLALRNRRWLIPYAATLAVAGLIPFLWLQRITSGYFFFDTVRLANISYSVLQIPLILISHAGPVFLFIGVALLISWKRFRDRTWEPIDLYLGSVLIITLISLGRIGAHGQYVVELLVVTLLYLLRTTGLPSIQGKEALVTLQIIFLLCYTPLFIFLQEGLFDIPANKAATQIYPLLRTQSGPILSQQGSFALFGRGEIFIQLFHFTALSRAGMWDQNLLLREINAKTFSNVITEFPISRSILSADDAERFTPEALEALRKNYRLDRTLIPYYLYVPQ
jgi:hypothetical protein